MTVRIPDELGFRQRCAELRSEGYTRFGEQLANQTVEALRVSADQALCAVRTAVASGRRVPFQPATTDYEAASSLYCWGTAALELLEHPTVHAIAAELLGDYLLNDLTVFSVPPAGDRQRAVRTTAWHRDCPLEPENALPGHLWFLFPLDDFTNDNGATWVVPATHRCDPVALGAAWTELDRERFPERRRLLLPAGDLAVLDARVIHSSDRNDTDRPRRLLNLGLVHAGLRARVRTNHIRIAGDRILGSASPRLRRLLGDRWPERPSTGLDPVLPAGWQVGKLESG